MLMAIHWDTDRRSFSAAALILFRKSSLMETEMFVLPAALSCDFVFLAVVGMFFFIGK